MSQVWGGGRIRRGRPFIAVVAQACFWSLDFAFVSKVSELVGLTVEPGTSLCDGLMRLVTHVMKCSEYDVLCHLKHRVDRIHEVIDRSDEHVVEQHKKTAVASIVAQGDFVK